MAVKSKTTTKDAPPMTTDDCVVDDHGEVRLRKTKRFLRLKDVSEAAAEQAARRKARTS